MNIKLGDDFMSKIMIALGGNALGDNPKEQFILVEKAAKYIVDLIEEGNKLVISHGNGPQIGMINLAFEDIDMSFPECGAMSQGYIGYHLQNRIGVELKNRRINKSVITVLTQTLVDEKDRAFENPKKPIGSFYSKEEADKISLEKDYIMEEDSGRGYRRLVPSPKPIDIIEKDIIRDLVELGHIPIVVGGGGIPTIRTENGYEGVAAVIDKDLASSKIADILDFDRLIIFTAVEKVSINFGKENQEDLDRLNLQEIEKYMAEGHFAEGSMLPKIKAAMDFVRLKDGRKAIIGSLEQVKSILDGKSGTIIE